jgi:Protein of unknown function (DUF2934)
MFNKVGGSTKGIKGLYLKQGDRVIGAPAVDRRLPLSLNDIRDRAYEMWVAAGTPPGDSARFWREAEQQMREGR